MHGHKGAHAHHAFVFGVFPYGDASFIGFFDFGEEPYICTGVAKDKVGIKLAADEEEFGKVFKILLFLLNQLKSFGVVFHIYEVA